MEKKNKSQAKRELNPLPETLEKMWPITFGQFDRVVEKAAKTPARKPAPKSR